MAERPLLLDGFLVRADGERIRVITRSEFCQKLREQLLVNAKKILLRIVVASEFDRPQELTGAAMLERAEQLASSFAITKDRAVGLLLLPPSPELFLLQLGLVVKGYIPAILAWPTSRVDPEKYQRNLVHPLRHLPANLLITLPRLSENLVGSLPYPASGLALE